MCHKIVFAKSKISEITMFTEPDFGHNQKCQRYSSRHRLDENVHGIVELGRSRKQFVQFIQFIQLLQDETGKGPGSPGPPGDHHNPIADI